MTAITSLSDFIAAATDTTNPPENLFCWIDGRIAGAVATTPVAGRVTSLWRWNKSRGGSGAIPAGAAVPTNTTRGCLLQSNPAGGLQKWLSFIGITGGTDGAVELYDRLLHCGGLSGTVTTAQTVGGTLTRNVGGEGNQIWVEIYSTIGTTATTITASYTNQAGVAGKITQAVAFGGVGNRDGERIIKLPLADGDTGVQSVQSVTLAATTGTAGNFGVTIADPLIKIPMGSGHTFLMDFLSGMPAPVEILTNACLSLVYTSPSSTLSGFDIQLFSVQK